MTEIHTTGKMFENKYINIQEIISERKKKTEKKYRNSRKIILSMKCVLNVDDQCPAVYEH